MEHPSQTPIALKNRSGNLRAQTLARLRRDIISGKLAPATVVREAELAAMYEVSITPLHEAMLLLEMEKLVLMPSSRVRQIAPISKRISEEIVDVIILLMDRAMDAGISRLSKENLISMNHHLEAMHTYLAEGNTHKSFGSSRRFFDIIICAGGNRALRRMILLHTGWIERLFTLAMPLEKSVWLELTEAVSHGLEAGDKFGVIKVVQKSHNHLRDLVTRLPLSG